MDKFLRGLLVVFGIIGMIDVSSGLKCYTCMTAPEQDPKYNKKLCSAISEAPEGEPDHDCTAGTPSDPAKEGIEEVKGYGNQDLLNMINGAQHEGTPTCVLASGTYGGKDYIVRDCGMFGDLVLGQCLKVGSFDLKDSDGKKKGTISEILVCGCNVDGCNGKNDTASITVPPTVPTEATTPEKTNKPQTTDNPGDGTAQLIPSATTFILGAIFFVYAKLFY